MDDIMDSIQAVLGLKGKKNDDCFDRLSSKFTSAILVIFAAIVTIFQLGDFPIACWFPAHFAESHMKFANAFCWVKNTYYLPFHEYIPHDGVAEEDKQMITYYQWVPMILLVQALLFKMPGFLWDAFNSKSGLDADDIMISAGKLNTTAHAESRDGILSIVTLQLDRFLGARRREYETDAKKCRKCITCCCHCCGRRFGAYLTVLFLLVKLLYVANVLCQMFALNVILNTRYTMYGFEIMKLGMPPDHRWQDSPGVAFPRVTMCDFYIRRLGNVQRYTVQCTLPLNLYYEKMYIFLWFWFVTVLACSIFGFLQWFIRCLAKKDKRTFVHNHLMAAERIKKGDFNDEMKVDDFMDSYLKQDGAFLLRLISHNTNHITTKEIVGHLWDLWLDKRQEHQLTDVPVINEISKLTYTNLAEDNSSAESH